MGGCNNPPLTTLMNNFQIGDLVAHKHYPENAIGKISKFYASGRVGVDDGCRPRSFLPSSLILWGEKITPGEVEEVEDAIPSADCTHSEDYKTCPDCGSDKLFQVSTTHNEYYFCCHDCNKEGLRTIPTPTQKLNAIANSEVREVAPAQKACPECGSYDVSKDDFNFYWCGNCHHDWEAEVKELDDAITISEVMEHPLTEPFSLFQKFDFAASLSEVMELRLKPENSPDRYETCPQCGSKNLKHSTFHDPDEYYFYCRDCGREGWSVPTTSPTPPAQVEEDFDNGCPECGGHELEATPFVDKLPASLIPDKSAIANEVITLPPIPRDFSNLKQWPEWWEGPVLPPYEPGNYFECDDDDDVWDWQESDDYLRTYYRDWLLVIYDSEIEATPPNSDKKWWCECQQGMDGPDGQIAIAQHFIDSWYFSQPSPGQLTLNILEFVARDPPPPPRLTA